MPPPTQPPTQSPTPQDLVEDARIVADHGMRSGALDADAPLFDALARAEAILATLAWTSPEYGNLQKAMTGAARAILPVTMHDLKSGWRIDGGPIRPVGQSEGTWFKGLVLAFTIVLLFFCGSLTNWQQQVKRVVAEFAEDKAQQRHDIQRELFPLMASLTEVQEKERLFDPSIAPRIALFEARHKMELLEGGMLSDLKTPTTSATTGRARGCGRTFRRSRDRLPHGSSTPTRPLRRAAQSRRGNPTPRPQRRSPPRRLRP